MNDDLRRELEAAGQRAVPDPRPGFATELEERLLAVARTPPTRTPPTTTPAPTRQRRPTFGFVAGLGGLAAVLLVVVVVGGIGAPSTLALELREAVNVEVALADGTTLVDPDGLLLPDGAVVRVGDGGSARVGDVVLGAGDVATVDDRRLQVDRRDDSTTTVQATPSPRATPTTPIDSPRPTTSQPTDRPETPRPGATSSPKPTPTPKVVDPVATVTPAPRSTVAPVDVKSIKLEARRTGPSEVGVSWTGVPGAARYILVAASSREGAARDPVYPGSPVIGEFTHPTVTPLLFRVGRDVVELRLLVVALSADGSVVGRSNIAIVSLRS